MDLYKFPPYLLLLYICHFLHIHVYSLSHLGFRKGIVCVRNSHMDLGQ